jgi:Xaa-Pro aminopeptidase
MVCFLRPGRSALLFLALLSAPVAAQEAPDAALAGQTAAAFQARRQALMEELSDGVVVLIGAKADEFGEYERFRQENDFFYLTGLERPGAALLLVPASLAEDGKARAVAFLPARSRFDENWHGPTEGPGPETAAKYGFDEALPTDQLYPRLLAAISAASGEGRAPRVHTHRARSGAGSAATLAETLKQVAPGSPIEDIRPAINRMRLIKSEPEIALLKKAIAITNEGHRDTARVIRPGAFEYEAQGAMEYAFTRNGAERPGFYSIVGSGPYSCVPHYSANRRKMEDGDLVVVDVGAEFRHYTADITRTYPVSGKFTPRQREVYQLVLDAQKAAEEAFVPGESTMRELQAAASKAMKESPLRDADGNTLDRYFIHGLGHWLGMDVHDVGDMGGPIKPGTVFTIEPGIYIPAENIGVRIEDDYLATETGLEKLSADLASDPDGVEAMMAEQEKQD